jgi:uncharacterized DUF497 family protein
MRITFDPKKRERTLRERGLDFEADAAVVFSAKHTQELDARFDYGEKRFLSAGYLEGRMVVIVWTPREDTRHVISMRYCHADEEAYWRKYLGGP